ncbi:MAG: Rieske 2Fe-2S domain-containing protein [Geitlerinemataceae cyanobacterium]
MSVGYKSIQWTKTKLIYDVILIAAIALYVYLFITVSAKLGAEMNIPPVGNAVRIRAYGSAAFVLLHVILSIGPLCRLNDKFLPLLFNRRHMGVTMFVLASIHAAKTLNLYHAAGNLDPIVSLFVGNTEYFNLAAFPFETCGIVALLIFFMMAATSHDFWLTNLTAPIWKALHMGVYAAYALLVGHVTLGALQSHRDPLLTVAVGIGMVWVVGLHLAAALQEAKLDRQSLAVGDADATGFVETGVTVGDIVENRAKIVTISGERVAIFKYDGKIAAVSNVCQHQNGPLGEGKIVDGCITCPWHGYQYLPENGASPPPFTEKIPTFDVRLEGDRIFVKAIPHPAGTTVEPAQIPQSSVG